MAVYGSTGRLIKDSLDEQRVFGRKNVVFLVNDVPLSGKIHALKRRRFQVTVAHLRLYGNPGEDGNAHVLDDTFHNNQLILGDPKSEAGKRSIPLDERLVNILRPHRQLNGFVIGDGLRPVTERTFIRTWQRISRTINLYDATPHVFRHTYLTIAASSGLDIKTLQAIAGHADIKMTMNCYVHKREEKIIEANDLIAGSFTAL